MVSETYVLLGLKLGGMSLISNAENADVTIFSTQVITTAKNADAYASIFSRLEENERWRSIHAMTEEKLGLYDRRGETWLYHAVRDQDLETSQQLLENAANPNQERNDGMSPIHIAAIIASNGNFEILTLLIGHNANCNKQTRNGMTALYISVVHNQISLSQLLLQKDANPDLALNTGVTPIFIAAQSGYSEMVALLLSFADQITIPLDNYLFLINENKSPPFITVTPLEIAEVMGHAAIVRLLRQARENKPTVGASTFSINPLLKSNLFSSTEEMSPSDSASSNSTTTPETP